MRQTELLGLAMRLKPGEAIKLSYRDVKEAADGDFTGLDLLGGGARKDDVSKFVAKISVNWDVDMVEDFLGGGYTMHKRQPQTHFTERNLR